MRLTTTLFNNCAITKNLYNMIELIPAKSIQDQNNDGIIIISDNAKLLSKHPELKALSKQVEEYDELHKGLNKKSIALIPHSELPAKKIIYSGTGSVRGDFDDVRRYLKAGIEAGKMAVSAGVRSPLLVTVPIERFPTAQLIATLGVMHSFHIPLNVRDDGAKPKVDNLAVLSLLNSNPIGKAPLTKTLEGLQQAFNVCRDIGDSDPQRMAPPKVAEYVQQIFKGSSAVKVNVLDDPVKIKQEYPLLAAVNRAADSVEAHKARVIFLEYENREAPSDPSQKFETLYIVGKGVTIDTGGTDLKIGSAMFGMSRDKYGSAVLAGFFKALDAFRPKGVKVVGCMAMVRNSIGSNSYTCDEIIKSRSGKRVHVYNTDAEGRMIMADTLADFRERALSAENAHLMTLATLTGHCILSYGNFSACMDNGPARAAKYGEKLRDAGDMYGQPVEVSRLCVEDFDFHNSECEHADLRQANLKPSVQTPRGHQTPAAFLMRVSRIDEHGLDSAHPLKYSHIDIGIAAGNYPGTSFPAPLLALIAQHILPKTV